MLENSENGFKNRNNQMVRDANKNNSKAVTNSHKFYEKEMQSILDEKAFILMAMFDDKEEAVKDKTLEFFSNQNTLGGIEFVHKFKDDLEKKIKNSRKTFKNTFIKNIQAIETEVNEKLESSISNYESTLTVLFITVNNEQKFKDGNQMIRTNAIKLFKNNCKIKDENYKRQQIEILERKLDERFSEKFKLLSNNFKQSEKSCKKIADEVFEDSYSKVSQMNNIFNNFSIIILLKNIFY
jgi:hypothetical protein